MLSCKETIWNDDETKNGLQSVYAMTLVFNL